MTEKHLHIIAFDNPYPPDYGGVIDIYYKLKTLWKAGVKIHLHCFVYGSRKLATELNRYCVEVHYYKRHTGILSFISLTPYIIRSRMSRILEERLLKDDHPVLCEGIHTCGILRNPALKRRRIIFRPSNVEHEYYAGLARLEKNILKKIFFLAEAFKLKRWESNLGGVSLILPVSEHDETYFRARFPGQQITLLYSFHPFEQVDILPGTGEYILFHGNLSVPDNLQVALYLLDEIVPEIDLPLVIAGKEPPAILEKRINGMQNVRLISNPGDDEMDGLIREAHIHLLLTFQKAGLKLKLLVALFRGRHIIVNSDMLTLKGLDQCVQVGDTSQKTIEIIRDLQKKAFGEEDIRHRKNCLPPSLRNEKKGNILINNFL